MPSFQVGANRESMALTLNSTRCGPAQSFIRVLTYALFLLWHETQRWEPPLTPASPRRKRRTVGRWGKGEGSCVLCGCPLAVVPRLTSSCLSHLAYTNSCHPELLSLDLLLGSQSLYWNNRKAYNKFPPGSPWVTFIDLVGCQQATVNMLESLFSPSTMRITGMEFKPQVCTYTHTGSFLRLRFCVLLLVCDFLNLFSFCVYSVWMYANVSKLDWEILTVVERWDKALIWRSSS